MCKHGDDVVIQYNRLQDVHVFAAESCQRACISAQVEVRCGSAAEECHTVTHINAVVQ